MNYDEDLNDSEGHKYYTVSNPNFAIKDVMELENSRAYTLQTNTRIKSASTSVSALPSFISNVTNLKMKPEYNILQPFYSDEYLNRLSNAALFDDVIKSAINRLSYFTLGTSDEIRSVLYPESLRPIKSELEAKNELKKLSVIKDSIDLAGSIVNNHLSDQEINDFETFIHYTDKNAKLGRYLRKNYKTAHVFGRSASYIEYSKGPIDALNLPAGTPIGLKPLKPMLLGNVAIDKDTWEIEAVEYRDQRVSFKEYMDTGIKPQNKEQGSVSGGQYTPAKYLDADNLLYFVRDNDNLMRDEDDFFFGHSTLQSILPMSEEIRRLKQIVFPQLNQSAWAGTWLWFFPTHWTETMMRRLFNSIKPGGQVGVPNKEITVQEMNIQHDYAGLINLANEFKKGILTAFGLPSFLMNFEDVTNRATAETVVLAFNESTIQAERSWLTDILDEQWYTKLFRIYYPNDEFIHVKMKMMVEFESITFESFMAKAVAAVSLMEKKIMTLTEVRSMLKLPPMQPKDYAELGMQLPGQVTGTPNLVNDLMAQKQQQMSGQGEEGGQQDSFDSQMTQMKADLLAE